MNYSKIDTQMYDTLRSLERENRWRCYIGGSYETAEIIGKYKVQIDDEGPYIRILIWNPHIPCIAVDIDKVDKIAVMNSLLYHPKCTIDGKMVRGEGTREMIEFAFDLMRKYGAKKVQLTDRSTMECNGKKVNLGVFSLFTNKKTWYENRFTFYPIGEYAKDFEIARKNIPILNYSCDFYTQENVKSLLKKYNIPDIKLLSWEKIL